MNFEAVWGFDPDQVLKAQKLFRTEFVRQPDEGQFEMRPRRRRDENSPSADARGEVAATTVVIGVHIDATARKSIRLPDDVRERALRLMRNHELAALQMAG